MEIYKANAEDLQEILRLQYLSYQSEADLFGSKDIPPLKQTLDEVINEYHTGIILKMSDKEGHIIGSVRAKEDKGTVYIGKLMVHPEHRHQGYGTSLLEEIEKYFPNKRYELFTSTRSSDNIRLYERMGYKIFKHKTVNDELQFVYLEKLLTIMKKIGLVGGIGPASTVEYYLKIIEKSRADHGEDSYPEIVIDSVNMAQHINALDEKDYDRLCDYLLSSLSALKAAGAEIAAITANTDHIVWNMICDRFPLPVISVLDATVHEIKRMDFKRVLVFGTSFTLKSGLYENALKRQGITAIIPSDKDKEIIGKAFNAERRGEKILTPTLL